MVQGSESNEVGPEPPPLKVVESEPDPEKPWADDALEREDIAHRLTRIVEGQEAPFVISVDGRWGTGKTFLLKRWAQYLQSHQDPKWQAIYYNAWEDDFADDPLLAIIAQFSKHGGPSLKERAGRLAEVAAPLLSYGVSLAALLGAGIPVPPVPTGTPSPKERLDDYLEKQAAKDELTVLLRELAAGVRDETGQPLVFIIDELDRCRPTFAIELLERVKHIFDVPNLVFVFGINRGELTESLRSVYGEIEAGVYLRRFFDMEFILPEADPVRFCRHLVQKFRLGPFFEGLTSLAGTDDRLSEFGQISEDLPRVLGSIGLSLRDMDYCVRLLSLAARDLPKGHTLYPELFVLLVAVKIGDPGLYRRVIQREARGAELIDYLNKHRAVETSDPSYRGSQDEHVFSCIEAAVYAADDAKAALAQLKLVQAGEELTHPQYLASETSGLDPGDEVDARRLKSLIRNTEHYGSMRLGFDSSLGYLAQRIDLYSRMTRR